MQNVNEDAINRYLHYFKMKLRFRFLTYLALYIVGIYFYRVFNLLYHSSCNSFINIIIKRYFFLVLMQQQQLNFWMKMLTHTYLTNNSQILMLQISTISSPFSHSMLKRISDSHVQKCITS